ncbi:hypothetical protein [Ureibacillus sp. GCM10028918]|uniref:hypothetical protein n=1 Tax=Ureibacillus sp. GCM10028918 TaxID=3273429 RepID=UPI00361CF510
MYISKNINIKKLLLSISFLSALFLVAGCSEQKKTIDGEFHLGNFGADWKEGSFHLVVPIEWIGDSSITIKSIEFIKRDGAPITFEEDGIDYEVFGADPMKSSGIYTEPNLGIVSNINSLEIKDEGKIVFLFSLNDVEKDSERRVKIKFDSNGEEFEKVVVWNTLEELTTYHN